MAAIQAQNQPAHTPLELGKWWIMKTQARTRYKLSDADFECLQTREEEENWHGGPYPIVKFSSAEVKRLAFRLTEALIDASSPPGGGQLAQRNGRDILHSKAIEEFGLTRDQLKVIKPVSVRPNPHGSWKPPMRLYNRCDVKALADRLAAARAQHVATWV